MLLGRINGLTRLMRTAREDKFTISPVPHRNTRSAAITNTNALFIGLLCVYLAAGCLHVSTRMLRFAQEGENKYPSCSCSRQDEIISGRIFLDLC